MTIGACIFGCSGSNLGDAERSFFKQARPLGFILFKRNFVSTSNLTRLTSDLKETVGHDAPILVDHEGGRVQRFRGEGWSDWLPALDQCSRVNSERRARSMWLRNRIIAHELASVGISANCAPLADIAEATTHPVLQNRCYGYETGAVVEAARAVADALLDGGLLPVLKHIPGHGGTTADSHSERPVNRKSLDELAESEFSAFRQLADLPLGITAHVVFEALDPLAPGTMSVSVIDYVRESIGFGGLLMTDDISMSALGHTIEQRVSGSLRAGCDLVLHCNGDLDEMRRVAEVAGELTPAAMKRFDRALAMRREPGPIDLDELVREFNDIVGASR